MDQNQSLLRRVVRRASAHEGVRQTYERVGTVLPNDIYCALERKFRGIERVRSLEEVDKRLARADDLFAESEELALQLLESFELDTPALPDDPFSKEYSIAQWKLYEHVSGRSHYQVSNEESDFHVDDGMMRPYPYSTRSPSIVGDYLIAIGFILKHLDVRPPARIVEFGPGWGNLTFILATMGFDVTAVEVGKNFDSLLREKMQGLANVDVVSADMLEFVSDEPYKVALFFESFHHCSDHFEMLRHLHANIVDHDGVVVFAGEPIKRLPYPWGLRLDGRSLWSTRRHGWLELGFDSAYFDEALDRNGWSPQRWSARATSPLADVIVAKRARPG